MIANVTPKYAVIWFIINELINWATQIQVPTMDKSVPRPRIRGFFFKSVSNWKIFKNRNSIKFLTQLILRNQKRFNSCIKIKSYGLHFEIEWKISPHFIRKLGFKVWTHHIFGMIMCHQHIWYSESWTIDDSTHGTHNDYKPFGFIKGQG